MEQGRLQKKVTKWSPPGRRKRGRPKLPGRKGLEDCWGGKGLMEEDWDDRENWKIKIR